MQALREPCAIGSSVRYVCTENGKERFFAYAWGRLEMRFGVSGGGADPSCEGERIRLREELLKWALTDHNRITMPDARIETYNWKTQLRNGLLIGYWDEAEGRPRVVWPKLVNNRWDRVQLHQVMLNLLSNAAEAISAS